MLMVEGKTTPRFRPRRYSLILGTLVASVLLWIILLVGSVVAVGISQGFGTTDKELQTNMIAALGSETDSTKRIVERANDNNKGKVVGIVTTIDSNLLTLTNSEAKVHITTSGEALTYVTDLNGDIKKGDFIAVSPLTGIGMKAGDSDTLVVGIALEDFNRDTATTEQVSTTQGSERTVLVNKVRINVEPQDRGQDLKNSKTFLVLFGQSLTGKSVSQTQVIVAMVIFFLLIVVEGSIIYGAVHSTIISIGRNPLARSALYQQLLQVSWLSLLVLLFGLGGIYAILWI